MTGTRRKLVLSVPYVEGKTSFCTVHLFAKVPGAEVAQATLVLPTFSVLCIGDTNRRHAMLDHHKCSTALDKTWSSH